MMEMPNMYTDYTGGIVLTIPHQFIDVKTGETYMVSSKVQEQIEYHANNQTLIHLILSSLNQYFHPKKMDGNAEEILMELTTIKQMLQGYHPTTSKVDVPLNKSQNGTLDIDMNEVEDILDVFGG
jgi:hypothetical protein